MRTVPFAPAAQRGLSREAGALESELPRKPKRKRESVPVSAPVRAMQPQPAERAVALSPLGWRAWLWVVIPILGLFVYANGVSGAFGIDPAGGAVHEELETQAGGLGRFLTADGPVARWTFALSRSIGGAAGFGHHLVNIILHILAALTLYGVVRRTLILSRFRATLGEASPWIALAVALIWLVHPLQTESVTYVPNRAQILVGLFYLLVIYAVLRSTGARSAGLWQLCAVVACAIGMGSHAVMVTAPIVVLLFDRTFLSPSLLSAIRQRTGLYVGLAASWVVLLYTGFGTAAASTVAAAQGSPTNGSSATVYLMTQPGVILQYLRQAVLPLSLVFDYGWQPVRDPINAIGPFLIIVALLLWTLWSVYRRRALGFLAAAYLLMLLPTSSVVPLDEPISEHRMYLPLAAVSVFAVAGLYLILRDLTEHKAQAPTRVAVATVLTVGALAALSYKTIARNRDYRDAATMWADVVAKRPGNVRAHARYGIAALEVGDVDSAEASLAEAVALDPNQAKAWDALGRLLVEQGRYEEGITALEQAINLGAESDRGYQSLGIAFKYTKNFEAALSSLSRAIWMSPENAELYLDLGNVHFELEHYNTALGLYDAALELDPDYIVAMINKAAVYVEQNRLRDAVVIYDDVLALDPDRESACNSRDFVLSLLAGEFGEADFDAAAGPG